MNKQPRKKYFPKKTVNKKKWYCSGWLSDVAPSRLSNDSDNQENQKKDFWMLYRRAAMQADQCGENNNAT